MPGATAPTPAASVCCCCGSTRAALAPAGCGCALLLSAACEAAKPLLLATACGSAVRGGGGGLEAPARVCDKKSQEVVSNQWTGRSQRSMHGVHNSGSNVGGNSRSGDGLAMVVADAFRQIVRLGYLQVCAAAMLDKCCQNVS